jgi:hypothetical protein
MDAFDYYLQGMPRTRQATRPAYDDAPFIWVCARRAIRLSPFTGLAFGHMFAGRCSEHDHDERQFDEASIARVGPALSRVRGFRHHDLPVHP